MINSNKKQSLFKRISLITLSVLIAVVSVFALIPKRTNKAKALGYDENTNIVTLENFPIQLNFIEYLSSKLYNACYTLPNTTLTLTIDNNQNYKLEFKCNSFIRNQGDYQDYFYSTTFSYADSIEALPFENNLDNLINFDLFYQDQVGGSYMYTAPTNLILSDYSIVRQIGDSNSPSYYLARLTDYVSENVNTTSFMQILNPSTLLAQRNKGICFAHKAYRTSSLPTNASFSTLQVQYSGECRSYSALIPFYNGEFRTIFTPILKLTFFGVDTSQRLTFELPCNLGFNSFNSVYPIIHGVIDTTSQSYINGYNQGFNDGSSEVNTNLYNEGYQDGQQYGYNVGYEKGAQANSTFLGFFSSIIDAPITVAMKWFDFEIMGINMSEFFIGLVSLCLITVVIRWFI